MLFLYNIFLFSSIIFILTNRSYVTSMTREQLKSSGKLVKNACMQKNNMTEDQVVDVDKGKFIEEKNFMCYIACVYKMSQSVSGNKINHNMMLKQVDMMFPKEMKSAVKATIEHCRDVAKNYKDICEASYWTAKCSYDFDPANFVFV